MRNRTTTILFLALLALPLAASAQAPTFVPVQGFLTDAEGAPVQGETTLRLALYAGSIGGTALFEETHSLLLEDGFFTVYLGALDPLDLALFRDTGSLYLGVSVNGEAEMSPRLVIGTVPFAGYAEFAGDAKTLDGHQAAEFRPASDAIGWDDLSGVPDALLDGDADALGGLTCTDGQVPRYDGTSWGCGDDLDTQLSEAQVEAFVTNGPIDLAAASTMDGLPISTGPHTTSLDWTAITNRPLGLDDGDDDSLGDLVCGTGEVLKWDGLAWACDTDLDTQLDEGQVEAYVTNGDLDMQGHAVSGLADPADPADAAHKDYVDQQLAALQAQVTALLAEKQRRHQGAVYRWATFDTYTNNLGWVFNNWADMFGGINPSNWTDNNYVASQMSSDKEVLRTLLTRKGYGGANAMVFSEVFHQYSSTTGKVVVVLFRIQNTTDADISWTPEFLYTCYSGWAERASLALNGANTWNSGGTNCGVNNSVAVPLTIPANRTSTVIVTSTSNTPTFVSPIHIRSTGLAFINYSLALPAGLEYVDDLDIATGGWEQ